MNSIDSKSWKEKFEESELARLKLAQRLDDEPQNNDNRCLELQAENKKLKDEINNLREEYIQFTSICFA